MCIHVLILLLSRDIVGIIGFSASCKMFIYFCSLYLEIVHIFVSKPHLWGMKCIAMGVQSTHWLYDCVVLLLSDQTRVLLLVRVLDLHCVASHTKWPVSMGEAFQECMCQYVPYIYIPVVQLHLSA